jgi:hypothetical protein
MEVGRYLFTDPGFGAVRRAAEEGVGLDATTYLHGLVLFPLFIAIVLLGELGSLLSVSGAESTFALWNSVPAWFWAASLVITRLLNVVLVVCSVYVTYRIGTVLADRRAGRIAALFTSLSIAVIHTAHEVNEDTPALFLLLVVLYLSILYTRTESRQYFLIGCALGGLAIAFKLTAGVAVVFLGSAYFLTALEKPNPVVALWKPRLLTYGLLLGVVTIYVGIPDLLLRGPEWFVDARIIGGQSSKAGVTDIPRGYSALLAYLNGLGLPLFIGAFSGLLATLRQFVRSESTKNISTGTIVLLTGLAVYLVIFLGVWRSFRTHHILPSVPLLLILFGAAFSRHFEQRADIARVVFAVMLLTTALYAGAGLYKFTNDARDEAADWMESEADSEATVAVFSNTPTKHGLVHGQPVSHYHFGRAAEFPGDPYTEWLLETPSREPEYIMHNGGIRDSDEYPRRAEFNERLMDGDHYGYVVAAEFGERQQTQSRRSELLYAGIEPNIEKRHGYTIILKKVND